MNNYGGYHCYCPPGYRLVNNTECVDIDECMDTICHTNGTCSNTIGSYSCACNSGYTGDGKDCTGLSEYPAYAFFILKFFP